MKTMAKNGKARARKHAGPSRSPARSAAAAAPLDPALLETTLEPLDDRDDDESAASSGSPVALLAGAVAVAALVTAASFFLPSAALRAAAVGVGALLLVGMLIATARRIDTVRETMSDFTGRVTKQNADVTRAARELAESKASTDLIMQTVTQGLFLMTPDYKIDGQYSKELEAIFRTSELRLFSALSLLQRHLTDDMFNTVRDYFGLLFDATKKERTVLKVNPLAQIEVNFANPDGGYLTRYLSFNFRRIVVDDKIARVFVAVNDVTERVELEQQLRSAETAKERQFNFLLGVLHAAPTELDDFLAVARDQLATMNAALRMQDFAAATAGQMMIFRQRLETVFRSVHTVKGHAQALKFAHFVEVCHAFEGKLAALRNKSSLSGDDFLAIVLAQSELSKDIEELASIRARFVSLSAAVSEGKERRATDLVTGIAKLAENTALGQQKQVRVQAIGFEGARLGDDMRRSVKDVLIQLTRNSVTHGIETPEERMQFGKAPQGTIVITAKLDQDRNTLALAFRDDGRGLDPEEIKARAVANGLITEEAAVTMPRGQAIGLIFHPGFSTADGVTEDAGRGFGMNIVKEIVADRLGGKINVKSEQYNYTEFSFLIPLVGSPSAADRRQGVPA